MAPAVKRITIFGATGLQGSSVVHSLLRDQTSNFKVRAITRAPLSEKSQALQSLGVEVARADGWMAHEIQEAFSGSWAAFVNTNSDDPIFQNPDGPTEFDLGKSIVDGIVAANVRILVLSSMRPAGEATGGKMHIKTMDMKARIEDFFLSDVMAQVHRGFPCHPDAEGFLSLHLPRWGDNDAAPFIAIADDFGDLVHGILLDPHKWKDQTVQAVSETRSLEEFVRIFSEATGKKARYVPLPSWKSLGEGVAELEDPRLLFAYGELTGGRYFGVEPSSTTTALELKKLAATAQGKDGVGAELTSLASFFAANFGPSSN
ncbi:putative hscarg dehydrogenase [Aspergillus pseudonomiae]|uniref:Putative hscarg dehydrogenase n=1 Tax=Aspergillus pseudonomiae TaxID=1506151 RepID=A0A5N6HMZ0_9EURO|nr:putative hscarg dehydrogenase [Aspergillus pseudonomiae]KAB8255097.1 putative hscarg dehydrogenase [Aspergillus pseudonomiae]KAE8405452.1 putative hscarg dehydrogenase [Aspergillus pseudonomiae]